MRFVGVLASVTLAAVLRACMGLLFAFSGGVARYLARFFFAVSVAAINSGGLHPVIFRSDALGAFAWLRFLRLYSIISVAVLQCAYMPLFVPLRRIALYRAL